MSASDVVKGESDSGPELDKIFVPARGVTEFSKHEIYGLAGIACTFIVSAAYVFRGCTDTIDEPRYINPPAVERLESDYKGLERDVKELRERVDMLYAKQKPESD